MSKLPFSQKVPHLDPANVQYIVLHRSATYPSTPYTPAQLELDHKARGFACCGYHYYVRTNGRVVKMRPDNLIGAHAKGYRHVL